MRFPAQKILGVLLMLLVSACGGPQPDFHVNIALVNSEESEDSNSTTETVVIDGYEGTYHWVYTGYHPDENFDRDQSYSFTLNDEEMHDLTLLVRENGLMVARDETVSSESPWHSFDVTWTNSMGGQSATGHVVGTVPETTAASDAPEDESKFAAEQVIQYVQDHFGPKD